MKVSEFKRYLERYGATFEAGHGSHLIVRLGDRKSVLAYHGSKEIKTGTRQKILKDLGLKQGEPS